VVTVFVGKGCDDAAISVTDDRRVVSDCADIIEFGGSFVPVSVDRQIQQERDSSAVSSPSVAWTEWDERSSSWLWHFVPSGMTASAFCASDTVWKELFELVAVFLGTAVDGGRRRHRDEAVAVIGSVSIAERGSGSTLLAAMSC